MTILSEHSFLKCSLVQTGRENNIRVSCWGGHLGELDLLLTYFNEYGFCLLVWLLEFFSYKIVSASALIVKFSLLHTEVSSSL